MPRSSFRPRLLVAAVCTLLGSASHAQTAATAEDTLLAQASAMQNWDLPASDLAESLARMARQSGKTITADPALVQGKAAPAVRGSFTVEDAAQRALVGSGLVLVRIGGDTLTVRPAPPAVAQVTAQPATTPTERALSEVRVEGSRDPNLLYKPFAGGQVAKGTQLGALGNTALIDSPFSASGYTEQAVRDVIATRITEAIAVDPAIRSASPQSAVVEQFLLRGFFVNGTEISFNETFAAVDVRRLAPEQFERIEVLKGPSALLNGIGPNSQTSGGVINVVPKRGTDVPLTRLTLSGNQYGQVGVHLDMGRRFGPDNALGLRVNAVKRDGKTGVGQQELDSEHLSLALDYAGEKLRASLDVSHNEREFTNQTQFFTFNSGFQIPAPPPTRSSVVQPWETSKARSTAMVGRVEYDIAPDATVYAVAARNEFIEQNFAASNSRFTAANGNFSASGALFTNRQADPWTSYELGTKLGFQTGGVRHRVVFGYGRFEIEGRSLNQAAGGSFTSNLYAPVFVAAPARPVQGALQQAQGLVSESVALTDSMRLLDDRLHVVAGLRYQRLSIGQFAAGVETRRLEQSATAPSLGVSYKITPGWSVYGNYAEGLNQGPTPSGTNANAGQLFPPFKAKQREVGTKFDFGGFGVSAALFQIEQPVTFVNSANFFVVDGLQRNRGLELSVYGEVVKGIRVNGGLALFNARQVRTQNGTNDGKKAIGIPDYNLVVNGEWDIPGMNGLTLTGRYTRADKQFASADNLQSIPSFDTVDLGLRYATQFNGVPTVLRLNVENISDSSHWVSVRLGSLTRSMPRTAYFSAEFSF